MSGLECQLAFCTRLAQEFYFIRDPLNPGVSPGPELLAVCPSCRGAPRWSYLFRPGRAERVTREQYDVLHLHQE